MALLEVRGLRAGYGRTEVLRGVDLTVPAGATVVLLGANGAGKSTLLKTIAGLVPVTACDIRFAGSPIGRVSAHGRARRGVCLIPEGRGIFRRLTVRENLVVQADAGRLAEAVDRAAALFPVLAGRLDQRRSVSRRKLRAARKSDSDCSWESHASQVLRRSAQDRPTARQGSPARTRA